MYLDTVPGETPAASATSLIVEALDRLLAAFIAV
jgi:hypothetical protein